MKLKYFISIFIILIQVNLCIAQWITKSVPLVKINSKEVGLIINKILIHEKNCSYYNDSISLEIIINNNEKDTSNLLFRFITLNQNNFNIILQNNFPNYVCWYKKHLCLIYTDCFSVDFFENLFKKYKLKYLKKNKRHSVVSDSDDFTTWYYTYNNAGFIFQNIECYCCPYPHYNVDNKYEDTNDYKIELNNVK
ncbi:MAG: hypothetical protein ACOYOV_09180 [Bacteroidales bacterium]